MTYLKVLNHTQKKEFESPPLIVDEARYELYTLSRSMELRFASIDRPINKIRFLAMYGYFKLSRTFYDLISFYQSDIDYIAKRYDLQTNGDSTAKNTLSLYKKMLREHFSFRSPDEALRLTLEREARHLIAQLSSPKALFYALVDIAISNRYEVPSYTFLVRIITEVMNEHKQSIFDQLKSLSSNDALRSLDLFLEDDSAHTRRYNLSRFKRISHAGTPAKIKASVKTFVTLRNIHTALLPIIKKIALDTNVARHHALWVEKSDMHQLSRKAKYKQQFDLICFVMHQTYMRTDLLCDTLVQSVQSAKLSALREHQNHYFLQRQNRAKASGEIADLLKNRLIPKVYSIKKTLNSNITMKEKLTSIKKEIDAMISDEQEKKVFLEEHEELNDHTGYHTILEERSRRLQNRVSEIVKAIEFDEKDSDKELLKAITFLGLPEGTSPPKYRWVFCLKKSPLH